MTATYDQRQAHLFDFVDEAVRFEDVEPVLANRAIAAWKSLKDAFGVAAAEALPVPDASSTYATWYYCSDQGVHHLMLEIPLKGQMDFFYRNRQSGELWEEDYVETEPLSAALLEKLKAILPVAEGGDAPLNP